MSAERDLYINAVLINGLPTCVFPAVSYHRLITNIVLSNGVASSFACYRGLLSSVPVAQNSVGVNQTVSGRIPLPAGQQFFVQWSAVGSPVSSAFARVSSNRIENPLDDAPGTAIDFAINAITGLVLPTGHDPTVGPVIVLDGTTGKITVIAANGSRIVLDPSNVNPEIDFYSPDGTNNAFINAVSTGGPSTADLGLNGGTYTPGDGIPRRGRLFFVDSVDKTEVSIIKQATQAVKGGFFQATSNFGFFGYRDDDASISRYMSYATTAGASSTESIGIVGEVWHTAALIAGWTGTLSYRLVVAPRMGVQVYGNLVPGTKLDGTVFSTLPVGYRAATAQDLPAMVNITAAVGGQSPHIGIQAANGVLWCFGVTAATAVSVNGIYSLDL